MNDENSRGCLNEDHTPQKADFFHGDATTMASYCADAIRFESIDSPLFSLSCFTLDEKCKSAFAGFIQELCASSDNLTVVVEVSVPLPLSSVVQSRSTLSFTITDFVEKEIV